MEVRSAKETPRQTEFAGVFFFGGVQRKQLASVLRRSFGCCDQKGPLPRASFVSRGNGWIRRDRRRPSEVRGPCGRTTGGARRRRLADNPAPSVRRASTLPG